MAKTMFEKIWDAHEVRAPEQEGGASLIYVDLHLVHEVTSPQAFEGLRLAGPQGPPAGPHARDGRPQRSDRPARAHRRSTRSRDHLSRKQVEALEHNCEEFGIPLYGMRSRRQGIVHVIGPELGLSPARHHDRLRRLAHLHARGARRAGDADRHVRGRARARDAVPAAGQAEDDAHHLRGRAGLRRDGEGPDPRDDRPDQRRRRDRPRGRVRRRADRGAVGRGAHDDLQHVDRGRRARRHDRSRRHDLRVPGGTARRARRTIAATVERWRSLPTDAGRDLRHRDHGRRRGAQPAGHVGNESRPGGRRSPAACPTPRASRARPTASPPSARSRYMALEPGTAIEDIALDRVFIGSCTNSRIEDLRAAAAVVRGRRVAATVHAMVVPGSMQVKAQAEQEGLDEVFKAAGFDWREAGCSMCLGMNPDILAARRALRLDVEPQLRGTPGPRRPHAPRQPADGGRGGDRGPLRGHPGSGQ